MNDDWNGVVEAVERLQDALNDLRYEVDLATDRITHPRSRARRPRPLNLREQYIASRMTLLAAQGGIIAPAPVDPDRPVAR